MFIWGSGHKTIRRNVVDNFVCSTCGRADKLAVVVDYDYSHIYWLFKSVKNTKTSLACENCGATYDADKERAKDLFAKLGGNPIPLLDRFGGFVLISLIVGVVGFALLSQASRDGSGAIVSAGQLDAFDIRLGDCFDDGETSAEVDESEISTVRGVPCSEPHDNEVFAVFDLGLDAFPEDDAMYDIAFDGCMERFESFVGRDYWSSSLDIYPLYPTRRSWSELNDREVICALYDVDLEKLQGSMRDSGI